MYGFKVLHLNVATNFVARATFLAACKTSDLTCVRQHSNNHVHAARKLIHFVGVIALGACNWGLWRLDPVQLAICPMLQRLHQDKVVKGDSRHYLEDLETGPCPVKDHTTAPMQGNQSGCVLEA